MNKSNIEAGQAGTEEQESTTVQNQHVSQPNANTNVVGSLFKSREIKFRAWGRYGDWNEEGDERNWQMIDGDSLCFEDFKPICDLLESKEDEEYFMQYTGLKDKTGKEIYEGDVLNIRFGKSVDSRTGQRYEHNNVTVKWDEDRWVIVGGNMTFEPVSLCAYSLPEYEIIGNVFENPELLETLR